MVPQKAATARGEALRAPLQPSITVRGGRPGLRRGPYSWGPVMLSRRKTRNSIRAREFRLGDKESRERVLFVPMPGGTGSCIFATPTGRSACCSASHPTPPDLHELCRRVRGAFFIFRILYANSLILWYNYLGLSRGPSGREEERL